MTQYRETYTLACAVYVLFQAGNTALTFVVDDHIL